MKKFVASRTAGEFKRSPCPISNALDILGDKWTLLVIRDLFLGKHLYGEFAESPERIPTNVLADRLKRLVAAGLIKKEAYQERPRRYAYSLTRKGGDLLPVLTEIIRWASRHVPGTTKPPAAMMARARAARAEAAD